MKAGPDWFGARVRAMLRPPRRPIRGTTYGYTAPPPAPSLPSWVPSAGGVTTFTQGGGVLTNNWRAIHDPAAVGYDPFLSKKVTDYSALFLHPTWRDYGALVIWGGGHSATNYNGVTVLTFDASTMYFECVATPTDWAATLDTGNISGEVNSYGEVTGSSPLRIAGPHSYGCGDVVGEKFVVPANMALGYTNFASVQAAHELDLSDPSTAASARAWVRRTASLGGWSPFSAPLLSRYVPAQDRLFIACQGGGSPFALQWFDLASNTWVTGSGTGFSYAECDTSAGDPITGALVHVPSRDLLICAFADGGVIRLQYMNVASGVSQPTLGGEATLGTSLSVGPEWGAMCWCSDSERLLVFGVSGNTDKVYEIEIPATLSNSWPVTSHTLAGGATIVPKSKSVWGKSVDYNPATRCVVLLQNGLVDTGNDVVTVYRPRST